MTKQKILARLREIREERRTLKRDIRDYEPTIEDLRKAMQQLPKYQLQLQAGIQLEDLRNEVGDLKDELAKL